MLLLHWTLDDTQGLGHCILLIELKLFPLGLQSVAPLVEGVPNDPRHLRETGLGLLSKSRHLQEMKPLDGL